MSSDEERLVSPDESGLPVASRTAPARKAIGAFRSGVAAAAEAAVAAADVAVAAAEPIVGRVQEAIGDVERSWQERPGARVRRVRRMAAKPLPHIYGIHPEARLARPVQVGTRTIDVADIAGTTVGGGDQRGGDFLPLKPFRGQNWAGRWQRLRRAQDRLAILPPIDVVKYDGKYWVTDGHNRVALALYGGQVGIDANITELVPSGGQRTEPVLPLGGTVTDSRTVRTAGSGDRPSDTLALEESGPIPELDAFDPKP